MFTRLRRKWTLLLMVTIAAVATVWFLGCSGESIGEALATAGGYEIRAGSGGGGNTTYTLTINSNPTIGGTTYPSSKQTNISAGTQVNITATAASGYTFSNWTISGSGTIANPSNASTSVTVNGDATVTANFTQNPTYTLTVNKNPTAGGTTNPSGNQTNISAGTKVNITATAASNYTFNNWTISGSGTIANPSNASTSVTVNGNVTVTAVFWTYQGWGTFTDTRDNKKYKTTTIDGKIWMAENLNYPTSSGSWCYSSADSCAKYGRLYDWSTAQAACPTGWRLPSRDEWGQLAVAAGGTGTYGSVAGGTPGKKLKARSGWHNNMNGTDDFGFSALPGGYRYSDGDFLYTGSYGYWWTATEDGSDNAYYRGMGYNYDYVLENSNYKNLGFSARCLKD